MRTLLGSLVNEEVVRVISKKSETTLKKIMERTRISEHDRLFCPKCHCLLDPKVGACQNPHCKGKGHR